MNLHLFQLADSALPVGSYSHSWALEAAIEHGIVRSAGDLESWVRSWLQFAVSPLDGIVVSATCEAAHRQDWRTLVDANELLWASLSPPTLRDASWEMGEQLAKLAEAWPWAAESVAGLRRTAAACKMTEWHHAPVFGTLAAASGAEPVDAIAVYLHQSAMGCIGAGVRAIPIGHTHGQQILARLHDELCSLAADFVGRDLESAGCFSPAYEVLCHAQSRLYTRLFRS